MSKSKKNCLTLYEKSKIIEDYKNGTSVTALAKKYDVAKSTICSIKSKEQKIMAAISQNLTPSKSQRCTLRSAENPSMEKALKEWFVQQREDNFTVTGDMLKQKALDLHAELNLNTGKFIASDGWLQKFKMRYGIRLSKNCSKTPSSEPEVLYPVKEELPEAMDSVECSSEDIEEWNKNVEQWNKDNLENCTDLKNEDNDISVDNDFKVFDVQQKQITHSEVLEALKVVTQWVEENGCIFSDILCLRNIEERAMFANSTNIKIETEIT